MDGDIIKRMREEEADLSRKLKAVRDFLAAYGAKPSNDLPALTGPAAPRSGGSREKVEIDGFGAYGRRIVATAMAPMLFHPEPIKTRDLVGFLESMKVQVSGRDPVNAVGALLSRSVDIVSHGKAGWTLADEKKAREIVDRYAHKENEPSSDDADGSDDDLEGAGTASDGPDQPIPSAGSTS